MHDANVIDFDAGVPRYWALILLSVVYRVGGILCLILTIFTMLAFTSLADESSEPAQQLPFPLPTFEPFVMPDFNFQQPPQLPNIDTRQMVKALGAFAGLFVLMSGLLTSILLYAAGQFLVLLIDHEQNMRVTAHGLLLRLRRG